MKLAVTQKKAFQPNCTSYGLTDKGRVRKHNEDSLLARPEARLWAVADGMGGHHAGDVASQMITKSLSEAETTGKLNECVNDIEDRLLTVNRQLLEKARQTHRSITIGSTVVILLAYGNYCVYMWAGDSRLYRLRDRQLRQMSTDHSQVQLYVEKGLISREEALNHPHGNMITRAVGADDELFVEMDIQELVRKDRYLLCSDGLTKHIAEIEVQNILNDGTAQKACQTLIDTTLERGAVDNVTAIVVDIN